MARSTERTRVTTLRVPTEINEPIVALAQVEHRTINGQLVALLELGLKHSRRGSDEVEEPPAVPEKKRCRV